MEREHTPSLSYPARSASRIFAGLFAGAYALLIVDLSVANQLWQAGGVALIGALVVLLGPLGFPSVERHGRRWLTWAYFAVQLPLGALIFQRGSVGESITCNGRKAVSIGS